MQEYKNSPQNDQEAILAQQPTDQLNKQTSKQNSKPKNQNQGQQSIPDSVLHQHVNTGHI